MPFIKKRKAKLLLIAVFLMGNFYAILTGGLYFFQENLLFHPTQLPADYTFRFDDEFDEVTHTTSDGAKLHGLHFRSKNPKGIVLYFHGNTGDLSRWGEVVQYFVQKNLDVIVMDYRNFGKSTGALSEEALYKDSNYWFTYAKNAAQESGTPLHIYGRSLGTTFATYVASKNEVAQLILETPFYSVEDEAISRFSWLPVMRLLKYKMPTFEYINAVNAPITILHGIEDEVVAYDHGKRLYESIQSENKTFITVPGGHHNDLIKYREYHQIMDTLFGKN